MEQIRINCFVKISVVTINLVEHLCMKCDKDIREHLLRPCNFIQDVA